MTQLLTRLYQRGVLICPEASTFHIGYSQTDSDTFAPVSVGLADQLRISGYSPVQYQPYEAGLPTTTG